MTATGRFRSLRPDWHEWQQTTDCGHSTETITILMFSESRVYPFFLVSFFGSLLLGACSSTERKQLTLDELRSKYGLEICAGSKPFPQHHPFIPADVVVFEVPSEECKADFFKSLERSAEHWEHPFGDQNRMQGLLAAGPVFLAQEEGDNRILIMIAGP